jgi:16S rRNA (guanine527-N7)-methyltransferase
LNDPTSDTLQTALARHQLGLPDDQVAQLDRYCHLLWEWNEKLNLTRHTDYEKFASRDVLDSVQLSRLLEPGEEVLDVGSGGGVPGILLAIIRPDLQISLSESVAKKAQVLDAIVRELDLPTPIYHSRTEDVLEDFRFHALIARAVGPLWKMCTWFAPHWHCFGRLLAIKGPRWVEERREARQRGLLRNVHLRKAAVYPMPGTASESVILKLWAKHPDDPHASSSEAGDEA